MIIILQPVLPLVTDAVAHTFWKLEHISAVHNHDGDEHVHEEILETQAQNETDKSTSASRYEVSVNPHLITKFSYDFSFTPEKQIHTIPSLLYHPEPFADQDDPPPKFI